MTCVIIKHIFKDTLRLGVASKQTGPKTHVLSAWLSSLAIKLQTISLPDQPIKFYVF